ncbi:uncharacterized protein LOC142588568 [Dermacentor variabilis]|uniref:uncharacterized protein LOC142588568 n=1 Tax=Dermacentor variabilis TaxID=34621 RepID=UPI003F5C035A
MPKPYRVVKFPEENGCLAVVPTSWLAQNEDLCFWPQCVKGSEVKSMVKNQVAPQQDWGTYPVVVMARCSTYDKATTRVKRAEALSGVDTTEQSGNDACHGDDDEDAAESPRLELPAPPSLAVPAHESIADTSLEPVGNGGPEEMMSVMLRVLRVQLEVRQQNRELHHELQQLRREVRDMSERLHEIESLDRTRTMPQPAQRTVPASLPRLPANSLEELEAAEAAVGDEAVAATLRKHLLQIGGMSLREVASNAMKAVMAHPVQVLYSLHGRKGKRAFINLKLCRIVTDVVCEKGHVDVMEAHSFLKKWLPGSVDRGGGRKRRFVETFAAEEHSDPCPQDSDHCLTTAALSLPHPCPRSPGPSDPSRPAASPANVQFCTRPEAM